MEKGGGKLHSRKIYNSFRTWKLENLLHDKVYVSVMVAEAASWEWIEFLVVVVNWQRLHMKTRSNFTANDILPEDGYCLPRYLPAYAGFYSSVTIRPPGEAVGYRTTKKGEKTLNTEDMHRPTMFCAACQNGRRHRNYRETCCFLLHYWRPETYVGEYSCLAFTRTLIQKKFTRCSMVANGNI